jgi:ribosomal protein L32
MTGLAQRIFRRGASGPPSGRRLGIFGRSAGAGRQPWGKQATAAPPVGTEPQVDGPPPPKTSFRERGKLRRRLRFLRRARELAYRDIGGLIFDMRRFGRNRQDLLEAKLGALGAVDQELRTLERALGDRRAFHELREPGISSCPRCGALHASDANFCPHCGLQLGGPRVMGEVGGAIAAPPQAPPAPAGAPAPAAAGEPAPAQPTQSLRPPDAPDGA